MHARVKFGHHVHDHKAEPDTAILQVRKGADPLMPDPDAKNATRVALNKIVSADNKACKATTCSSHKWTNASLPDRHAARRPQQPALSGTAVHHASLYSFANQAANADCLSASRPFSHASRRSCQRLPASSADRAAD